MSTGLFLSLSPEQTDDSSGDREFDKRRETERQERKKDKEWCPLPTVRKVVMADLYRNEYYEKSREKPAPRRTKKGKEKFEITVKDVYDDHGLKHGMWKAYYETGKLYSSGKYTKDKKQGPWIKWHKSGKKASEQHYKDGINHGKFILFDKKGNKTTEIDFDEGMITEINDFRKVSLCIWNIEDQWAEDYWRLTEHGRLK